MSGLGTAIAGGKSRGINRHKDDWYPTPEPVTRALLQQVSLCGPIWEPACGDGRMAREIERFGFEVVGTDLVDRGYGQGGIDFLMEHRPLASTIVTNPPFKLADEFIDHALALGVDTLALLMPLGFLGGIKRADRLWNQRPPSRIMISSRRFSMWPGDIEAPDDAGSSTITCAWYVWDRSDNGTRMSWFDWRDYAVPALQAAA